MGTNGMGLAPVRDSAEIKLDAQMTTRMVESLVLRGDISAMSPEDRTRYYTHTCEALGLNPLSQPFALLKLNGKEVMYPTRGATDQLAAIHRLNREVIDGPKVVDIAGTKMAYAVCRATHPNGRIETAVATVPLTDPLNALMKAETKAKRRATLSILGLGMLDETELDTIPAAAKAPAPQIDPARTIAQHEPTAEDDAPLEPVHPELARLGEMLTGAPGEAIEGVLGAYGDLRRATNDAAVIEQAHAACRAHIEGRGWRKLSEFQKGCARIEREIAAERRAAQAPAGSPLTAFLTALARVETPAQCVALWRGHKDALATLPKIDGGNAWEALVARCEDCGQREPSAREWIKAQLAAGPKGDGPKGGQPAPVVSEATEAQGDAYEGPDEPSPDTHAQVPRTDAECRAQVQLLTAIQRLRECDSSVHVARHHAAHMGELPEAQRQAYRDAAVFWLQHRYSKAVRSRDAAERALDEAIEARDSNGVTTRAA